MTLHPEEALKYERRVVVGNPYHGKWVELIEKAGAGPALDLGSGNNPSKFDHLVKLDVFPLPNVDVVGLAENLPFRDGVFKLVFSGAVLEHVLDPFLAMDQIHRVLADDGELYIETAFLQPLHAYPNHYFNMTLPGLEHLCGSFHKIESGVQPHQYPSFALRWLVQSWAQKLPRRELGDFLNTTVGQIIAEYEKDVFSKRWLTDFTPSDLSELACGVYFHGRRGERQPIAAASHRPPTFRGYRESLREKWGRLAKKARRILRSL
jgi:SAM-dependent methyltransferase